MRWKKNESAVNTFCCSRGLVVVVGIFLGLQADDWYRSRTGQQQLATYLQAVSKELETAASLRRGHIAWHERVIDGLVKVSKGSRAEYRPATRVQDPMTLRRSRRTADFCQTELRGLQVTAGIVCTDTVVIRR